MFLTAGVDVQKDRIELEVVAWGRGKESWSVDYLVLEGSTAEAAVWERLTGLLTAKYPTSSGALLQIFKFGIDSGYATQEVYSWARMKAGSRAMVVKGDARAAGSVGQPSPIEVGSRGNRIRGGVKVWPVNGAMIKEELFRWLHLDAPADGSPYPPGYCHFPQYGEEYFKQLTAEQLLARTVKGYRRPEWQKTRDRNEALDCRVYARAAAALSGIDRMLDAHWAVLEHRLKDCAQQRAEPKRILPPPQLEAQHRLDPWLRECPDDWLWGRK